MVGASQRETVGSGLTPARGRLPSRVRRGVPPGCPRSGPARRPESLGSAHPPVYGQHGECLGERLRGAGADPGPGFEGRMALGQERAREEGVRPSRALVRARERARRCRTQRRYPVGAGAVARLTPLGMDAAQLLREPTER